MRSALLCTPHLRIEYERRRGFVCIVRSSTRFERVDEIEALALAASEAMASLDRSRLAALVDAREAPPSVKDAHQRAFGRLIEVCCNGFARQAVLVASALGSAQAARRAARETGEGRLGVFMDEALAFDFLSGQRVA